MLPDGSTRTLLYIGETGNFPGRMSAHKSILRNPSNDEAKHYRRARSGSCNALVPLHVLHDRVMAI